MEQGLEVMRCRCDSRALLDLERELAGIDEIRADPDAQHALRPGGALARRPSGVVGECRFERGARRRLPGALAPAYAIAAPAVMALV